VADVALQWSHAPDVITIHATLQPTKPWLHMTSRDQLDRDFAGGSRTGGIRVGAAEPHLEVWLRGALSSTYDRVLAEPLPDDWVRLIGRAGEGSGRR
jgi:hypothetical protein